MKIIDKTLMFSFLAAVLTACSGCSSTPMSTAPTINSTDVIGTVINTVKTKVAMTQMALPTIPATATFPPPTNIPSLVTYPDGLVHPPPADKVEYAMATAPKVYNLLPYINETAIGPYGEHSGCAYANDFHTLVRYGIDRPLDTVISAFERYFQKEKWAFTEAMTELVGSDIKVPEMSYDVYRVVPGETPAFERLQITLRDESALREKDHIDVRLVLTHIENKYDLKNFPDIHCAVNTDWHWMQLQK